MRNIVFIFFIPSNPLDSLSYRFVEKWFLGPLAWRPPEKLAIKKPHIFWSSSEPPEWEFFWIFRCGPWESALINCPDDSVPWSWRTSDVMHSLQNGSLQVTCEAQISWFGFESWQYDFYIFWYVCQLLKIGSLHINPNFWPPLKHQHNFVILNASSLVTVSSPVCE